MKILIVEDEHRTANYIQKGLSENGFTAVVANNGVDGLHQLTNFQYDLAILDVMLPDLDGWSIIRALRQNGQQLPVLFLTARDQIEDKVKGLEYGADDYLVKPFAFSELLARVRTLLRRGKVTPDEEVKTTVADLEIDFHKQKVSRSGKLIRLTSKEFSLMSLFIRNQGVILSRATIAEQVWDVNFDTETNAIDVAIRRLRQKIDEGFSPKLIHTIRGVGYVFDSQNDV